MELQSRRYAPGLSDSGGLKRFIARSQARIVSNDLERLELGDSILLSKDLTPYRRERAYRMPQLSAEMKQGLGNDGCAIIRDYD